VVLRSHSPWGPFSAYPGNPILTQRDLDYGRPDPIAAAGHADLVQAADGHWWATFLGVRPYENVHYNSGRETFLLPVDWRDGWPVILPHGQAIPYAAAAPAAAAPHLAGRDRAATPPAPPPMPTTGNFTWRDDFDAPTLKSDWLQVRVPQSAWADLTARPGWLTIHPLSESLDTLSSPSFLARRQQHTNFEASTALELPASGVAAGIGVFQNEQYWYFLGVRRHEEALQVFLEKDSGQGAAVLARIATHAMEPAESQELIKLKVVGHARRYSFYYAVNQGDWNPLLLNDDGVFLSTDVAGGFVGVVLGPYARAEASVSR
jgi:alpha-N-arabinofuranosidase